MGGGMGMGGAPAPTGKPEDTPFITCAACKALVRRAAFVTKKQREALRTTKLTEEAILTSLSGLCDPDVEAGEWLHSYDMVEQSRAIELKRMPTAGVCGVECRTIGLACSAVLNEADAELATGLFQGLEPKALELATCGAAGKEGWASSLEGACHKPAPLTPESRPEGEPFERKLKPEEPPPAKPKGKKKRKGKKGKKASPKAEL